MRLSFITTVGDSERDKIYKSMPADKTDFLLKQNVRLSRVTSD